MNFRLRSTILDPFEGERADAHLEWVRRRHNRMMMRRPIDTSLPTLTCGCPAGSSVAADANGIEYCVRCSGGNI